LGGPELGRGKGSRFPLREVQGAEVGRAGSRGPSFAGPFVLRKEVNR